MKLVCRFACATLLLMPSTALAQPDASEFPVLPPTLDEEYAALAEQVPGFGGLFHDPETGRVIVRLKDLGRAQEARKTVGDFLAGADRPRPGVPSIALLGEVPELAFIKGEYDFRDLARWRRQIEEAALDVLTMSDIDEVSNRVLIGVTDEAARAWLARDLKDLGIPPAAVNLRVIPPVVEENLQGFARPVRGGLQVKAVPNPPGIGECTLGFVALREFPGPVYDFVGPRFVITASHCTTAFGSDFDDVIGQPTQAQRIGVEYSDPPLRSNASDSACPSSSNICRRSDAALFLLDDNSDATSTFNGVATASGLTLTGTTFYAGKQQGFGPNQRVAKIGRTTGQTSGAITNTCVNVPISGRVMVCQMYATYASQGGDSGSPVWYTDLQGNRWIVGIHWGRDNLQNRAIFSTWLDAWAEIGNDVLARTGVQWTPALTTGPANFGTQ
jgi:hypothetical protein